MSFETESHQRSTDGATWKICLVSLAAMDLLTRLVVDVVGLGDSIALPVSLLISSRYILDLSMLGWVFGWVLYGSIVFQMAPLLLPKDSHEWGHSLPNRITMSVSAISIGVFTEQGLLQYFNVGSTPLPLSSSTFPLVVVGIVTLVVIAMHLPPIRIDSPILYTFEKYTYPIEDSPSTSRVGPYLLVVGILGVLLAHVSLLFPIPELIILGVLGINFGQSLLLSAGQIPARREHAERIVQGASAIWAGLRGLVWVGYIAGSIFVALALDAAYLIMLDPFALLSVRPYDALFTLYCLGVMTTITMVSSTRLAERVPAQLHDTASKLLATERSTPPGVDKERVPGFLLHAGIPIMILELARPDYISNPPVSEIPALHLSPLLVGVAIVAGVVGLVSLAYPSVLPTFGLSDYEDAVLSFTGLFTTTFGIGFYSVAHSLYSSEMFGGVPAAVRFGGNILHVVVLCLVPYLGYELFREDGEGEGNALAGIIASVGTITVSVIVMLIGQALSVLPGILSVPGYLVSLVGLWGFLVGIGGIGVRTLSLLYL